MSLTRALLACSLPSLGFLACQTETVDLTPTTIREPLPLVSSARQDQRPPAAAPNGMGDSDNSTDLLDEPSDGAPEPPQSDDAGAAASNPQQADEEPLLGHPEPDDAGLAPEGCKKIDLLFIVDNSLSMRDEQDNLIRSFPSFIEVIQRVLGNRDYQIMVVDTDAASLPVFTSVADAFAGNLTCDPAPSCCGDVCVMASIPFIDSFVSSCNGTPCSEVFTSDDDVCEGTLGAGRRLNSSGDSCGLVGTRHFMLSDQPDLATTFSCAADVGTHGNGHEQPMAAMAAALSPLHNGSDGCNEGFLRDDALLVVTFITDEEDADSPGTPENWRQSAVDAKGGNEASVVVLGLVGDQHIPGGLPGGPCTNEARGAPRLQEFVESFSFGSLGSVCAPDYTPFFEAAVTGIETSCREFVPVIR
jgi:hypothetical protein